MKAIEVQHLSFSYEGFEAIRDISFSIDKGSFSCLVGPNGAGKSTVLKCLVGLEQASVGEVKILGKPLKQAMDQLAYVPQRDSIAMHFPATVWDFVLMGRYRFVPFYMPYRKLDKEIALHCLEKTNILDLRKKGIAELSGGQFKRMLLARAFAQEAEVLVLDEPFAGVDVSSEEALVELLQASISDGKTVFIVHHDLLSLSDYAEQTILINKSLIAAGPTKEVLKPEVLKRAYGRDLSISPETWTSSS